MAWNITLTGKMTSVTVDGGGEGTFTASGADAETQDVTLAGFVQHVFSGNDQIHTRLSMTSQGGVTEIDPWISVTGSDLTMTTIRAVGVLGQAIDFIRFTGNRSLFANWWIETDRHGCVLSGANRNTFNGMHIECGSQADNTWDGINVSTSDFNLFDTIEVVGDGGANDPRCGVNITDAASNDNYVGVVHAPDATDPICDTGTDTILIALRDYTDSFFDFYNGTMQEPFDALVTEAAGVVTMSLTRTGGGDLTMRFSDGQTLLDVTPAATIALTVGSDAAPQGNWIYIPQTTKVLTKSTTTWPTTEHIKIGFFLVPSAAFVSADGPYINQNWNDPAKDTNGQGHYTHHTERSRLDGAYYFSGLGGAGVDDYLTLAGVTADLKINAGVIYQMHRHTFPAFDTSTGDVVLVKNWSGDAFHNITNLFDITADSTGAAITNNRYFNLVIWAAANKTGEYEPVLINLPSGFYNTQADAENDVDGLDDFSVPREFRLDSSTGMLIARLTIQMKTAGPWVYQSTVDLRGFTPITAAGGAAGAVTEFADNQFKVFDETDITKIVDFQASGITTGTTRTLTIPDASGTILLEETVGLWETWSPAYTNLTVGNGTVTSRFVQIGDTVIARFLFTLGSTSSVGSGPTISMPVAGHASYGFDPLGVCWMDESGTGASVGSVRYGAGDVFAPVASDTTGSYAAATGVTATIPFTWGTGDTILFTATYEAA